MEKKTGLQKLLDALNNVGPALESWDYDRGMKAATGLIKIKVLELISEEEAEYQQWKSGGWVSVDNKEGMDSQPILFTDGDFIAMGHYWAESKEFTGNVAGCYDDRWTLEQIKKWQPLPKV